MKNVLKVVAMFIPGIIICVVVMSIVSVFVEVSGAAAFLIGLPCGVIGMLISLAIKDRVQR